MKYEEAIEALEMGGGLEIGGKPKRVAMFFEALELGIEALEKQIPKKPIKHQLERFEVLNDGTERWNVAYFCPRCESCCGSDIVYSHAFKYPTCQCGQKIDWSK